MPRFRLSPGLGPQVIQRRPLQEQKYEAGEGESDGDLPEFYTGFSKAQVMRVIREAQEMGVPMDLPPQFNKMSREQLLNVVRETYGEEMDAVVQGGRVRPGGRIRLTSRAIQDVFRPVAERMSSYRRGGMVRNRCGVF